MDNMISKTDAVMLVHLHSDMLDLTNGRSMLDNPIAAVARYKRLVAKTGLSIASDAFLNSLDYYAGAENSHRSAVAKKIFAA
jgi:L-ascorbate metabolism protein UlaG (beta-lactamase superfamily)